MASVKDVERFVEKGNVASVRSAMRDRNPLTRRRAAQALGELARPEGVPALAHALQHDKDPYVIQWCIESLRQIGTAEAVECLTLAAFGAHRKAAALASQALTALSTPEAEAAHRLRETLQRNEFSSMATLGTESQGAIRAVLNSQQFEAWPSGKRKPVLETAIRLAVTPPAKYRRDLIEMGIFVSGMHNIGDLLYGLDHSSAHVRSAAADRLGASRQRWVTFALHNRFRREIGSGGDHGVAIAAARALALLGDERGITYYKSRLYGRDSQAAVEAIRALSEIGTPIALHHLFWFAVEPPPPPAFHNTAQVVTALANAGTGAIEALKTLANHDDKRVRTLWAQITGRSGHPEAIDLLMPLCHDTAPQVQQAALDALVTIHSPQAATALYSLQFDVPQEKLHHALVQMTIPESIHYLRQLVPDLTSIQGQVLEDGGEPLVGGSVQIVQEHHSEDAAGWGWANLSARAETTAAGEFWLAILDPEAIVAPRLKVTTRRRADGKESETWMAAIEIIRGGPNRARVRIDSFFARIVIDTRVMPEY